MTKTEAHTILADFESFQTSIFEMISASGLKLKHISNQFHLRGHATSDRSAYEMLLRRKKNPELWTVSELKTLLSILFNE